MRVFLCAVSVLFLATFCSIHGIRHPRYPIKVVIPFGSKLTVNSSPENENGTLSVAMLADTSSKDGLAINIVGHRDGKSCILFMALGKLAVNGERLVATNEELRSLVMSIPDRSEALERFGWIHKTIRSGDRYVLFFDDRCRDPYEEEENDITWQTPGAWFKYSLVPRNDKWELELEDKNNSKPSNAIAFPSGDSTSVFLVAPVGGLKLIDVTVHVDKVPPSLAANVKRHAPQALVRYGGTVTVSFTPQIPTAVLTIAMFNVFFPKYAVIYNIVGHRNGKLCVANFWTQPSLHALMQKREYIYDPFDLNSADSKIIDDLMVDFTRLPRRVSVISAPQGMFDPHYPTGFLGDCEHNGDYQWDQLGKEYKIKFYPYGSRWHMKLEGGEDAQLEAFALPAYENTFGFTSFAQHGMELHSMRITPAPEVEPWG